MFECKRIDRVDGNGRVLTTGVAWNESNPWSEALSGLRDVLAGMTGGLALVAGIMASIADRPAWLVVAAAGVGLMAYAVVSQPLDIGRRARSLVFNRDGRIEAPQGFPFYESAREMSRPLDEIASIEARQIVIGEAAQQTANRYGVAVYLRNGDIVSVARRLDEFEAHKVAVQLSVALADMRQELGNSASAQRGRAKHAGSAVREEAVIG